MQSLIVGYGSIGRRHADILTALNCKVALVTSQAIDTYPCFNSIKTALEEKNTFDQIIIANQTHLHFDTLKSVLNAKYTGNILVEKPLFSVLESLNTSTSNQPIYVAYNFRFHALLQKARDLLIDDTPISFSARVGSYLPHWRKNQDYRNCYSAKKNCGGGVLRDLSHELDYAIWFCGKCHAITALGGHYSTLEIDSDDVYSILMRCERCPVVSIHLDYLSRLPFRQITMQTKNQNTIFIDLIKGELVFNGDLHMQVDDGISQSYYAQHSAFLNKDFSNFCDYMQGMSIVRLISAAEEAALKQKWINL